MMKKTLFTLIIALLSASISFAQNKKLPNIEVKNLNGTKFTIIFLFDLNNARFSAKNC